MRQQALLDQENLVPAGIEGDGPMVGGASADGDVHAIGVIDTGEIHDGGSLGGGHGLTFGGAGVGAGDAGELVAEGFATAGGEDREGVAAVQEGLHGGLLEGTELAEAPGALNEREDSIPMRVAFELFRCLDFVQSSSFGTRLRSDICGFYWRWVKVFAKANGYPRLLIGVMARRG